MPRVLTAIPSPLHPWCQRILGFIAARRLTPHGMPYGASLSLETVVHLKLLPNIPSRVPIALRFSVRLGAPCQCPCFLGGGFPSLGLRDRTCAFRRSPPISWPCQSHGLRAALRRSTPGYCSSGASGAQHGCINSSCGSIIQYKSINSGGSLTPP